MDIDTAEQLEGQIESKALSLKELFAADPKRAEKMTVSAAGWTLDYSKNLLDEPTLKLLLKLAEKANLRAEIERMFTGEHINETEDRAVLHTALRSGKTAGLVVDVRARVGATGAPEFPGEAPKLLEIRVEGPDTAAVPEVIKGPDGLHKVSFVPNRPGTWHMFVTIDGMPIQGSPFTISVGGASSAQPVFVTLTLSSYPLLMHLLGLYGCAHGRVWAACLQAG